MSSHSIGSSYEYLALCDICKFEYPAKELRQRWDGKWCCKEDWEARHPMDFYRAINDVHELPFIRSNVSDKNLSWTPTYANLTVTLNGGETQQNNDGNYNLSNLPTVPQTAGNATIDFIKNSISQNDAHSTTSSNGTTTTMTLPTTPTVAGRCTVITREGKFLGSSAIAAGVGTVTLPAWTATQGGIVISFTYGT